MKTMLLIVLVLTALAGCVVVPAGPDYGYYAREPYSYAYPYGYGYPYAYAHPGYPYRYGYYRRYYWRQAP